LEALAFMDANDFAQVVCRESGRRLRMITVSSPRMPYSMIKSNYRLHAEFFRSLFRRNKTRPP
jgi:hypothetical protein